ncbi:transglycosylase SLT domain-containing protein [Nordella sp. HKS 07]|uniref:lytic transglycosylase domain-containing protein n=1 Tax=Nordella sp. HKS 07 TaxID=2712222 RepID=UPI001FEE90CF|nr:transglycosylase SLT domain-containing protein [Nordella sp. HKS 07]
MALLGSTAITVAPPLSTSAIAAPQVSRSAVNAADAAFNGKYSDAGSYAQQSGDPAAAKLVELIYLRNNWKEAGYSRIMAFLSAAPQWPLTETLLKRAEQSLYASNASAQTVFAHFEKRTPLTPEGSLAIARAQLATGNSDAARRTLRRVWLNETLDAAMEKQITSEFGSLITSDDRRGRMWRLVYKQETNAAIRVSKSLSGDYQSAAKVAQALIRGTAGAEKQYQSLPSAMRQQLGMRYAMARYYRKANKQSKAAQMLLDIPADNAAIGDGEAWWVERRLVARMLLDPRRPGSAKTAYQLARAHGFSSGEFFGEGEFLAGWIALRFMKDENTALKHFAKLQAGVTTRTDKARAAYWMGRSYAALGDKDKAKAAYREAATVPTVYYGQLAREQLGIATQPIQITGGQPSAAAQARVDNDEVMRAFQMVAQTGRSRELNMFLWSLSGRFKTTDEMSAVARNVSSGGGPAAAVRLAKLAGQKGVDIDYWGYPTKALPDWRQIGPPVERAMVFGLSRQESEFDPKAGSRVGAQGLMQLMPGTAKLVAKQYRLSYAPEKLTGDPAYNVKLGAAHLGDLIEEFGGSYILTLAAYNAGPRRSREWVEAHGDPRSGTVDPIDWVEMIPFTETRNYVQKVMQNVHVYRSRLAPKTMHAMTADLRRGAPGAIKLANSSEAGSANCSGGSIAELITGCD